MKDGNNLNVSKTRRHCCLRNKTCTKSAVKTNTGGVHMSTYFIPTDSHLHLHHMDGVPAPFDLLGSIAGLLDENNSSEAMIQVPEVHRGHATLKVPGRHTWRSIKGNADHLLKTPNRISSLLLTDLCTGRRRCWPRPRVSSGGLKA